MDRQILVSRSDPEGPLLHPVFDSQSWNALEFPEVVGDQGEPFVKSMRRNQKVIIANRCSGALPVRPDLSERDGGRGREVPHLQGAEEFGKGELVFIRS